MLIGIVAMALVATVTVVTIQVVGEPRRVDGIALPLNAPGSSGANAAAHEPQLVAEVERHGTFPKKYGRPSEPDPGLMEVHGQTAYLAYTTSERIHSAAINLADGTLKWARDLNMKTKLGAVGMVVTDVGVLLVINFNSYAQFSIMSSLETGKELWHITKPELTVSGVANNHLMVYNREKDKIASYAMVTKDPLAHPKWAIKADGGRTSTIFQKTRATYQQRRDAGDRTHVLDVGTNPDDNQYIVDAVMYNGNLSVRELATGTEIAKGNAGEKMVDVVAYEDTVYAYRQTPRTLAAYAATDLSKPKWSVETPSAEDGSYLKMCADNLLCLKIETPQGDRILGVDAASGQIRWKKTEYRAVKPARAGATVAFSHKDGTTLLDPKTGDIIAEFSSSKYALPGKGVIIGFDNSEIQLLQPGDAEPRSLGSVPDKAMTAGACEWTSEVALCAGKDSYKLWRYRG